MPMHHVVPRWIAWLGNRSRAGAPESGREALAYACYDQAHFGNELRAFTGMTPTQYLGVRRRFLREHPGHPLDFGPLPAA